MSLGLIEALSGLNLLGRLLNSTGALDKLSGKDEISREEFRHLIEDYSGQLMTRKISKSDGKADAGKLLEEQDRLRSTLEPLLFAKLDQDHNGALEEGEIEQLKDFIANFDRRLLIESKPGAPADPFEVLQEMAHEGFLDETKSESNSVNS